VVNIKFNTLWGCEMCPLYFSA